MKTILIILIIVLLVSGIMILYKPKEKETIYVSDRETDFMKDWRGKVSNADLNKDVYEKTEVKERYNLIYYYTQNLVGKYPIEKLPTALKVFYMIDMLEAQVNNGGFHQLFMNSSGAYIDEMHQSLGLIKANHTQSLLEQAVSIMVLNGENPESLNKELRKLKPNRIYEVEESIKNTELYEQLGKLDNEFYKYKDNLSELTLEFIDERKNELWEQLNTIANKR